MTDVSYATDFFSVNRWMLCQAGLWAPKNQNYYIKIPYKIYAIFIFLYVNLYFTTTEFVSVIYTYENINDLIKNINFALTHLMGAVKVIFWFTKGNQLLRIIEILESNQFHYNSVGEFHPGLIHQQYKRIGKRNSMTFFTMAYMTLLSSYIPAVLVAVYILIAPDSGTVLPDKLPYFCWMPFRYDTAGMYLVALFYQSIAMFSYLYSIVGMDTLFMNMMNNIAAHLTILQGGFKTVREMVVEDSKGSLLTDDGLYNSDELRRNLNWQMKRLCQHLQIVLKLSQSIEDLYQYVTFAQALCTMFILCTCLYLVSTAPMFSKQFSIEIIYFIAMLYQMFLYCWFGNEVAIKAECLPDYIWDCDWITSDRKFKQKMMFTMMRMRRPLNFTFGKFAPLTLPTFMAIIKASYSIFAVIKNTSD